MAQKVSWYTSILEVGSEYMVHAKLAFPRILCPRRREGAPEQDEEEEEEEEEEGEQEE